MAITIGGGISLGGGISFTIPASDPYWSSVSLLLPGQSFTDASSNNLTITNNGATISSAQTLFGSSTMNFNGSNFLSVASNAALAFGTGDFTVEYWMYATSLYDFITVYSTPRSSTGFNTGTQGAGQVVFYIAGSGEVLRGNTSMAANAWNHCAFTRSGTTMRAFLNGNLQSTAPNASNNLTQSTASIGSLDNAGERLTGYLSNLRITKGVARYTASFSVPTAAFPIG